MNYFKNSMCYNRLNLQSYIRLVQFIIVLIILLIHNIFAEEKNNITPIPKPENATLERNSKLGIYYGLTHHELIGHADAVWVPYISTGLQIEFPTYINRLILRGSIEAGQTHKKGIAIQNVELIHLSLSVSYDIPLIKNNIFIRPRVGLSNLIINISKTQDFKLKEIFQASENLRTEFGFIYGIEPVLRFKKIFFSFPISMDLFFSQPDNFFIGNFSVNAGVVF